LGIVGFAHDHVWGLLRQFKSVREIQLVAAADKNRSLLQKARKEFGTKVAYSNYSDLIEKEAIDAILLCTENSRHAEVVEAASEKGIHVIMEKPMSADFAQAKRIVKASEKHGIKVMVNYPTTWSPGVQLAYRMVKEGKIGSLHHVRFRAAHSGPKEIGCPRYFYDWLYDEELNGAGAFMDYCCYGANLALWFLGRRPKSVIAFAGTLAREYLNVDDNAIVVMEYNNAIGVAEASWSQVGTYPIHGPILNGLYGTIATEENEKVHFIRLREKGNYRDVVSKVIDPPRPPEGWRSGPQYFVKHVMEDKPLEPPISARFNLGVQEVLEAGLRSAKKGKRVALSHS